MLSPKRTKYRKPQSLSYEGLSKGGNTVVYGEYGLQATSGNYVTANQIESCRVVLARFTRKVGKSYIRIFPQLGKTKKPAEVRMGSGKGSFEVGGVDEATAREALKQASYKLPLGCRIVKKGQEDR